MKRERRDRSFLTDRDSSTRHLPSVAVPITNETFTALLLMALGSTMLTIPMVTPRLGKLAGLATKAG